MQQLLTPDAFRILSESYVRIGAIGVETIALSGPAQQASINKLIDAATLYDVVLKHIILNDAGTAVVGVVHQDIEVINDLLFDLKRTVGLYSLPVLPTPLTTYQFNFGNRNGSFDILPGNLGDLIVHNGTTFTNFGMGPSGSVLTSTPTGLVWSNVVGNGLPSGGTTNQYLRKNSNTSFDAVWDTLNLSKISDVTASPAEVNILDGATLSTTELNFVDGVNSPIQTQLNGKMSTTLAAGRFFVGNPSNIATAVPPSGDVTFTDAGVFSITPGVIVDADINSTAAITRSKLANGAANRIVINSSIGVMTDAAAIAPGQVLISDGNGIPIGSPVTAATLIFLDATSSVQTQLNSKLPVTITSLAQGDMISYNGTNWVNFGIGTNGQVLTSNGSTVYWGSATGNGIPAGGTPSQYLRKIDSSDYNTEWHTLVLSDVTDMSVTSAVLNQLVGLTVASAQINSLTGIGGNVQLQLDGKQNRALAVNAMWVGNGSNLAAELSPGADGYVLTMVGSVPQWQPPTPPGNVSGVAPTVVNTITRWNDTGGSSIKGTGVVIDDSDNISAITSLTLKTAGAVRTSTSSGNTLLLQAYDVDGTAYTTFATLTAGNTPAMDLAAAVTIGGQYIYRVGGTDVSLADGGTGASLTDPGADRIMFWDDSAGVVTWLTIGSNLSITGTTLNATGGGGTSFQQREEASTTYTIQASDSGYLIYFTSVTGCIVTIPVGLTADFTFTSARAEGAGVIDHISDGTSVLNTINGDTDIQNENTAVTWAFKGANNWYGFGALGSGGSGGSVNSVAGTTNRISISGTGADPIVDISASYVGQASITTLGTVATGTWNATTIDIARGGTGLTSLGSALQLLRVNSGATALEYFTPTYISGNQTITLSGDVSGSGTTSITTLLATVNSNVGTFGSATQVPQFTVNGKGLITAASNVTITPAASSITGGQPLTRVDDTNVTLTLGGSATTSLLAAASITAGWAGQLAVTRGGTGLASVAQGDLLYGSATNTISALAKNASATRYLSNTGSSNSPAWAQVNMADGVTGILSISNGGSGSSSQTWWGLSGTSTLTGASTIAISAPNQLTYSGSFTTTANNQYFTNNTATVTLRNVAADAFSAFGNTGTFTIAANNQSISIFDFSPTYNVGSFTGNVLRGITYNPTISGLSVPSHVGLAIASGRVGFGTLTPNSATIMEVVTPTSGEIARFRWDLTTSTGQLTFFNQAVQIAEINVGGTGVAGVGADRFLLLTRRTGGTIAFRTNNSVDAGIITAAQKWGLGAVMSPTAMVHLPAGTATANTAPLKITNGGTLLTTPESGAIETTNTHIYWTDNAGTRFQLDQQAGGISGLTAGRVPYANSSTTITDEAGFEYDATNNRLTADTFRVGSTSVSGDKIIDTSSSSTNASLNIVSKGTGVVLIGSATDGTAKVRSGKSSLPLQVEAFDQTTGAYIVLNNDGTTIVRNNANNNYITFSSNSITSTGNAGITVKGGAGTSASTFGSGDGVVGTVSASDVNITGGNAYTVSGNGNGGNVLIQSGQRRTAGSGVDGIITLDPRNKYVLATNDVIVDDSAKGFVWKSPDGHYWRATVSNLGVLSTADLGTSLP